MLWAAAVVTLFTFCRSGETTVADDSGFDPTAHLSFSDVAVDRPVYPLVVYLLIKHSKMDQGREGDKVFIGQTGDDLCPVSALLDYLKLRGGAPGALFRWQDGFPLS